MRNLLPPPNGCDWGLIICLPVCQRKVMKVRGLNERLLPGVSTVAKQRENPRALMGGQGCPLLATRKTSHVAARAGTESVVQFPG